MFAGGLLKATEHDLTSLFMTRMQCIGLAKDGGIQKGSQYRHSRTSQGGCPPPPTGLGQNHYFSGKS